MYVLARRLSTPNSAARRTPSWQRAQVVRANAAAATDELGSVGALMVWIPWQSVHTGDCQFPRVTACPWMLTMYSCFTLSWHLAQVAGTLNLKIGDLGLPAER